MTLPEPTEHNIQLAIQEYLTLNYPRHYFWRNNSGALPDKRGALVRFGKVGSADILGITPEGQFVALEIKRPSGRYKPTPAQLEFLEAIKSRGGIAGIVTSLEEVSELLKTSKNREDDSEMSIEPSKPASDDRHGRLRPLYQ